MKFLLPFLVAVLFIVPAVSFAQSTPTIFSGINIWQNAYCGGGSPITITQGPPGPCSLCDGIIVASNVLRYAFELVFFILFPIFFAWGGIQYMTSAGNPGKLKSAKQVLISTVVGLLIAAAAWVIVGFVFSLLTSFSGNTINIGLWKSISCN